MTRPEIIRADSIDLQDHNAPSAKDHTRQPAHPAPLGVGPPAPHQAEALRDAATDDHHPRSPRVSKEWSNGENHFDEYGRNSSSSDSLTGANLQQQDDLAVAQNGGLTGSTAEDAEMADAEGDDSMDDDMMDKISSSPSIDDAHEEVFDGVVLAEEVLEHHHLQGEYLNGYDADDASNYELAQSESTISPSRPRSGEHVENYEHYYDLEEFIDDQLVAAIENDGDEDSMMRDIDSESLDFDHEGILTVPYEASEDEQEEDDDAYEFPDIPNERFTDSGWGGECLQELEDIDFEFVYALHTFVATVEGQANATKGDTMVLLDDSNSYWWLVRVVKDSSIGYLPAEHIETPTERLARLNKHRNIDLTSAMLGDPGEKSKNPLKKVIRRRNAKTVTFAPPTYVEASDVDYSTDEEEGESELYGEKEPLEVENDQKEQQHQADEIAATEPLKAVGETREIKPESGDLERIRTTSSEAQRESDEVYEGRLENNKSRNGTVRNTDSFFKDDSVETKKITLTPNLLRDDSSTSTRTSNDSKEFQKRPSLDKLEKDSSADKKDKKGAKEKKEKDKKPGMLSGLFKRKDKKSKSQDEEDESHGKRSTDKERGLSPVPSKDSEEIAHPEEAPVQEIQRNPSKLQKFPRSDMSPIRTVGQLEGRPLEPQQPIVTQQVPAPTRPPPAASVLAPSMRLVEPENGSDETIKPVVAAPDLSRGQTPVLSAPKEQKPAGTISKILRSGSSSTQESKPVKAKKSKSRVELDDFDSFEGNSPIEEPHQAPSKQIQRPIPGSFPDSYIETPQVERSNAMDDRLSESPVEVSPITPSQSYLPPLMVDNSSQEEPPSPMSSPSPDVIDVDEAREKKGSSTTSTSTAAWSDTHLRTFFDDDSDIKDLLVVVYDKSGVVPAGPDHPITGNLFREENAKLADITNRLDGMLGDWLARKMRTQSSR